MIKMLYCLLKEAYRRYKAQQILSALAEKGSKKAQEIGLRPEDFGGPWEE